MQLAVLCKSIIQLQNTYLLVLLYSDLRGQGSNNLLIMDYFIANNSHKTFFSYHMETMTISHVLL